jgi:hypothetical protein
MRANVILETNFDAMLMVALLKSEHQSINLRIIASGPKSSFYSKARTLLGVSGEPVALVINTETTDPASIAEQRQTAEEVIGATARSAPFCLLLAQPSLESLLFTRPSLLAKAFGDGADEGGRALELGRLSPRDAYKRLEPGGVEGGGFLKLFNCLNAEDVAALREESPVRELIGFLAKFGSPLEHSPSNA